jgi:acylphosphatase
MVEVHAEGNEEAVDSLVEWLATGPAAAHVTSLDVVTVAPIGAESFDITM